MPQGDRERLEYHVYEVFAKTGENGSHEHQFSLLASSPDLALALAQENFLRRREVQSVWVVRRDHIHKSAPDDPDELFRLPKTYRETSDYRYLVERWRRYRQEALNSESMT